MAAPGNPPSCGALGHNRSSRKPPTVAGAAGSLVRQGREKGKIRLCGRRPCRDLALIQRSHVLPLRRPPVIAMAVARRPDDRASPSGHVAEWLRSGLQNRLRRFNSGRGLHFLTSKRSLHPPLQGGGGSASESEPGWGDAASRRGTWLPPFLCHAIWFCCYAVSHVTATVIPT